MRRYFFHSLAIIMLMIPLFLNAQDKQDESEIKQLLNGYVSAFNSHNPKSMASFWADDGDLINLWGEIATGRDDVQKVLEENDKGKFKNSQLQESIEFIHFVSPTVAVVDVDRVFTGMLDNQGNKADPFATHGLYVLAKNSGKWQIAAFRTFTLLGPIKSL